MSDSVTPWNTAHQASLSITNSRTLPKLMFIESVMPSNHPLSSPSPPAFNPSQHHCLFKWVSFSHQVAKILEFQLQHQSFLTKWLKKKKKIHSTWIFTRKVEQGNTLPTLFQLSDHKQKSFLWSECQGFYPHFAFLWFLSVIWLLKTAPGIVKCCVVLPSPKRG